MRMMDAIVKPAAAPGLELRQVPVPTPGAGEVLIKVHKTAICGTDVHIYDWNEWSAQHVKPPMVIGHEYVGEIAELGAGVTGLTVGQRVSGEGHITCGHCRNCHTGNIQWCKNTTSVGVDRDGAFAEYVCIPARNVVLIDPSLDEDVVAMFDAVGNATHTALMFNLVGEDVLITGAGPVGILAVAIAKYAAVNSDLNCLTRPVVVEPDDEADDNTGYVGRAGGAVAGGRCLRKDLFKGGRRCLAGGGKNIAFYQLFIKLPFVNGDAVQKLLVAEAQCQRHGIQRCPVTLARIHGGIRDDPDFHGCSSFLS